jgi:hypothetical protein
MLMTDCMVCKHFDEVQPRGWLLGVKALLVTCLYVAPAAAAAAATAQGAPQSVLAPFEAQYGCRLCSLVCAIACRLAFLSAQNSRKKRSATLVAASLQHH